HPRRHLRRHDQQRVAIRRGGEDLVGLLSLDLDPGSAGAFQFRPLGEFDGIGQCVESNGLEHWCCPEALSPGRAYSSSPLAIHSMNDTSAWPTATTRSRCVITPVPCSLSQMQPNSKPTYATPSLTTESTCTSDRPIMDRKPFGSVMSDKSFPPSCRVSVSR